MANEKEKTQPAVENQKADADGKQHTAKQKAEPAKAQSTKTQTKSSSTATVSDGDTRKIIYCLCYIFGILFFLPLILYKNDAEANRHANQGLVLLILSVIGNAVLGILTRIPAIGWLFGILAGLYSLVLLVFCIVGIVYVVTDQQKDLPFVGQIHIIK